MLYLTTGANGTYKTATTLQKIRAQQLAEGRPVYYYGFDALKPIEDFGWQKFDPKEWQKCPDGSILFMDEAQNEFPLRKSGSDVPPYVNAMAQDRRKRGFDVYMNTPHPMLIDVFIRRLIETPSWHRHLKRPFGGNLVSETTFSFVNTDCDKPSSSDKGTTKMLAAPKEVYGWYTSATLHTAKKKIPRQVWLLAAICITVPLLGYVAFSRIGNEKSLKKQEVKADAGNYPGGQQPAERQRPLTAAEYADTFKPRIGGLPHTASRYDTVLTPKQAPLPLACVSGYSAAAKASMCQCWSQQATVLPVPEEVCKQIVAKGFFRDDIPPPSSLINSGGPSSDLVSRPQGWGQGYGAAGPHVSEAKPLRIAAPSQDETAGTQNRVRPAQGEAARPAGAQPRP